MTSFDTLLNRRTFIAYAATAGAGLLVSGLALAGCSDQQKPDVSPTDGTPDKTPDAPPAESGAASQEPSDQAPTPAHAGFIVVFSRSGNTLKIAERIAAATGLGIFRIETVEPYPDDYDAVLEQARREQSEGIRPELIGGVDNWERYDTVYFGYPTWWSHLPPAVEAFLEQHSLNGKTVAPFNTSGSSGFASTLSDIAEICPEAAILEGLALYADTVDSTLDQVEPWVNALGLEL